uniref:Uncharacterized protein n=1 Tax=Phytophthora ramorum TaxID=164328 RepID=H3GIH6_PHYRM
MEELQKLALACFGRLGQNDKDQAIASKVLRDAVQSQQLEFANIQGIMSEYALCIIQAGSPLQRFIHLSRDEDTRRDTLLALTSMKLDDAGYFLRQWPPNVDPCKPMCEDHRYELSNGDFCSTRFTRIQFHGVGSVKQVFDMLVQYFCNIEISISEKLGHITIREDGHPKPKKAHKFHAKKREFTYLVRKEEARVLQEKPQALRKELKALQEATGSDNFKLRQATTKNQVLKSAVRTQQLTVACTQSVLSNHLRDQHENPMYTRVVLPKKCSERREVLTGMKNAKFMQCYSYLTERSGSLDMTKNHFFEDRFEDAHGNFTCHRFDVVHFCGVQSLKQVYDALTVFMFNMEISVSKALGDITVREDYDSPNDCTHILNHRLISNCDSGVTTGAITVSFAQHFEDHNALTSSACALAVMDSVDEDDLYPYDSANCVRRDITAAVALAPVWRDKKSGKTRPAPELAQCSAARQDSSEDDEELVVVMRRAALLKVRPAESEMADRPGLMLQTIRAIIHARAL